MDPSPPCLTSFPALPVHHMCGWNPRLAQEIHNALVRGLKLVTECATHGPFYSLLHDGEISSEFVNCAIDLGQALAKVSCRTDMPLMPCSGPQADRLTA
jgi:hypothetical protein